MTHKVVTFGCRLNIFESEIIKSAIPQNNDENIVIFNTCAVTKEAEKQARQSIRKAYNNNPDTKIIVTGCAAQLSPEKYANMPEVTKVLGNSEKFNSSNYNDLESDDKILLTDIMSVKEASAHMVTGFQEHTRAFVQVQNGCNHRCTFCIIPYARGNSRSIALGDIAKQVRHLVEKNYKEVVITGVDITDYGKDLPGSPTLGNMIKRLLDLVPNLPALRLSSIDVAEVDDELMHLIKYESRLMPHIHISMQAGDDMILKRMKRRHTRQQVLQFIDEVRKVRPEVAFGADIIAGFPTETEEMFNNTLNLVHEAKLQFLHVFPYSIRENTPAARMPQVDSHIKKVRAEKLRKAGAIELNNFLKNKVGNIYQAIVEKNNYARCADFTTVQLLDKAKAGEIVDVQITKANGLELVGKIHKNINL